MAEDSLQLRLHAATRGRYEVVSKLGAGGMATVYLAKDLSLPRNVAIKVLSPDLASDEETVERFRREAKVAAALDHPNIVSVFDVGDDPALAFFVMQHIDGVTLANVIETQGPQPLGSVIPIISSVGKALHHAHTRGIIHRDVKPANLMREASGRMFVTDFGIAKREEMLGLTASGAVFGTPQYMSPEQYNGLPATGASDQYALGVVLFELVTGRLPFVGESVADVMAGHLYDVPPPVMSLRPELPGWLDEVVQRMMSKEPDACFASVEAVVQSLGRGAKIPALPRTGLGAQPGAPRAEAAPRREKPLQAPLNGARVHDAETLPMAPAPKRADARARSLVWVVLALASVVIGLVIWR